MTKYVIVEPDDAGQLRYFAGYADVVNLNRGGGEFTTWWRPEPTQTAIFATRANAEELLRKIGEFRPRARIEEA